MSTELALVALQGSDPHLVGRVLPLGEQLRIGRRADGEVELVVDDKLLSGKHASIIRVEEGFEFVDHGSKNGSFVDGERVVRKRLKEGSVIRLGVHVFQVVSATASLIWQDASVSGDETHALVGRSSELGRLVDAIDRRSKDAAPVLLAGEFGTGKEAAARRLHAHSGRRGEFVSLACGSTTPEVAARLLFGGEGEEEPNSLPVGASGTTIVPSDVGLAVLAHEGTLYLDGVDGLDRRAQAKLAAIVRDRRLSLPGGESTTLDVRLVAGVEVDLDTVVAEGQFSPELRAVFAEDAIELPALRSRRCDIGDIATHAWANLTGGRPLNVSATAHEKLLTHDWPQNVRELVALLVRVLQSHGQVDVLRSAYLPPKIRDRVELQSIDQLRASAVDIELVPSREELASLLDRYGGDVGVIARFFAREKRQVYRWLKRHDLKLSAFKSGATRSS